PTGRAAVVRTVALRTVAVRGAALPGRGPLRRRDAAGAGVDGARRAGDGSRRCAPARPPLRPAAAVLTAGTPVLGTVGAGPGGGALGTVGARRRSGLVRHLGVAQESLELGTGLGGAGQLGGLGREQAAPLLARDEVVVALLHTLDDL